MLCSLRASHFAACRIFIRDLKAEYAQSVFWIFWSFVDPLIVGFIFYLLHRARIINSGELDIPYGLFVVYGALLYQTFDQSLTVFMDILRRSGSMLTQLNLSPEALLLSSLYRCLFDSVPRILVLLAFSVTFGVGDIPGFLAFLVLFPLMLLPGIAIGLLLAPFNAICHDIGRSIRVFVTLLRYVSPVLYPLPVTLPFNVVAVIFPVIPILNLLRSLATASSFVAWSPLLGWTAGLSLAILAGWFIFHVSIPVIAEKT